MNEGRLRIVLNMDTEKSDSKMLKMYNSVLKTTNRVERLRKEVERLKDTRIPTEEYEALEKEIEKVLGTISKLEQKQESLNTNSVKGRSKYKDIQRQIEKEEKELEELYAHQKRMNSEGSDYIKGEDTEEYQRAVEKLAEAERDLDAQTLAVQEALEKAGKKAAESAEETEEANKKAAESAEEANGKAAESAENVEEANKKAAEEIEEANEKAAEEIENVNRKASEELESKWVAALNKIKGAFKMLKGAASVAASGFKKLGAVAKSALGRMAKNLKKPGDGIGSFAKRVLRLAKMVFIFRLIRQAFTAMLNGMKEGINNYAQYSESFNKTMSDFKTATGTAKNALAAMVVPILSAVIPALTTLVNWITTAAHAVSNFMAVVSGRGTWSKAKTQVTDYAKSLKGAAGASDKLKQSLAGFDDLDVLNTDSSSGGGGGSADVNPADMWSEENAVKPEWFNPDDWTSLGVKLGEGLAGALDMIPWDSIQEKARNTATRMAEVINGFISVNEVWTSLGHGIAEGLNTGVIVAYTLLSTINFKGLGQGLGSLINQAVSDFDWNLLGATVGAGINGIFGTLLGFVTTLDWGELGSSFAESINSALSTTDWGQIAEAISESAIGLVTALSGFLGTLDWQEIAEDIIDFISKLNFSGLVKALSEAIGHGLGGLALFVGTLIGSALDGIADYFNDKIEEAGGDIVAGIFKGITDALDGIIDWLRENIFNPFIESFCELFGIHSPSTVFAEFGTFLIEGFLQGIADTWNKITSFFSEKFENIKNDILDFLGNIKKDWSENWQKISDKVTEIWEDMWDGMKSFLKETVNGIIGLINGMLDGLVSGINSAIRALNKLKVDIPDWVPKIGGNTFGFNIPEISAPQIPLLANGGITTGSTLAMIGEAGKEAVLPLENNTGWMEDLAEVINGLRGDRPINLQIDGKTFARLIMPFIDDESDIIGTSLSTV